MKLNLKEDVTLICVDGVNPELALKSLKFSNLDIGFSNIKLLSPHQPNSDLGDIKYIKIPEMSWDGYNDFICKRLIDYIETPFCLTIQTDGFIVNGNLWNDEFFEYDYIGAPWPDEMNWINLQTPKNADHFILNEGKSRIGNGGFSLRSLKFLEESSKYNSCEGYGEDCFLCNINYKSMLEKGIKFPSVELACRFAIENPIKELGYFWPNSDGNFNTLNSFGFHGKYIKDYDKLTSLMNSII